MYLSYHLQMTAKKINFSRVLYAQEVEGFLRSFVHEIDTRGLHNPPQSVEQVVDDLKEIWTKTGRFFRPGELRKLLMRKYLSRKTDANVFDFVETVERERFDNTDSLTGYMRKTELGLVSGLAHLYALCSDEIGVGKDIAVMDVDFSNMGGTNTFFQELLAEVGSVDFDDADVKKAESLTDMAAKTCAQIILRNLKEDCGRDAVILPVRAGGDELRIVFNGVEPSDFRAVKEKIHKEIEETMAQFGLHGHPHLKAPNDPLRNGFGAAVSIMAMKDIEPSTYMECADAKIAVEKQVMGAYRRGEIPHSGLLLKRSFNDGSSGPRNELVKDTLLAKAASLQAKYSQLMQDSGTAPQDIKTILKTGFARSKCRWRWRCGAWEQVKRP